MTLEIKRLPEEMDKFKPLANNSLQWVGFEPKRPHNIQYYA